MLLRAEGAWLGQQVGFTGQPTTTRNNDFAPLRYSGWGLTSVSRFAPAGLLAPA